MQHQNTGNRDSGKARPEPAQKTARRDLLRDDAVFGAVCRLTWTQARVWLAHYRRAWQTPFAWPSVALLVVETGMCDRAVQRARRQLIALGFLEKTDKITGRGIPRYKITAPTIGVTESATHKHEHEEWSNPPPGGGGTIHRGMDESAIPFTSGGISHPEASESINEISIEAQDDDDDIASLPAGNEDRKQEYSILALSDRLVSEGIPESEADDIAVNAHDFQEEKGWLDSKGRPIVDKLAATVGLVLSARRQNIDAFKEAPKKKPEPVGRVYDYIEPNRPPAMCAKREMTPEEIAYHKEQIALVKRAWGITERPQTDEDDPSHSSTRSDAKTTDVGQGAPRRHNQNQQGTP